MSINKKLFSKAASDTFEPTKHFNTVLYKGTGATQKIGAYINQGGEFNGSNSKIEKSNLPIVGNTSFTISLWVKPYNVSSEQWVIQYGASSGDSTLYLQLDSSGFSVQNFTTGQVFSLSLSANVFYHCVIGYDSTAGQMFIQVNNGTRVTKSATVNISSTGLLIGHRNGASNYFDGVLDQIRIFTKALSTSEVTTLFNETFDSATKLTTDIFSDRSAVLLYQLEGNANDTGGASGYFGQGAILDGASNGSQILIPDADVFSPANNDLSFSIWINTTTTTAGYIASKQNDSSVVYEWQFFMNSNGTVQIAVYTSGGTLIATQTSTATVNDGDWHNVAFVIDTNSSITVYIDKTGVTNSSWSGTMSNTATDVGIGFGGTGMPGNRLKGTLDQARFFNTAITQSHINSLYDSETAITSATLDFPSGAGCFAAYDFNGTFQDISQTHDGVGTDVTFRYDGTASNVSFQGSLRFALDLLWVKNRDASVNHILWDSVRTNYLFPNLTNQEEVTSDITVNTNGWTTAATNALQNSDSVDYTAWCWKGNGPAVNNSNGSISSSVSANTAAGFSIVSYTGNGSNGATVGHGLNASPNLWIIKQRSGTQNWLVGSSSLGASDRYLILDGNNAELTNAPNIWSVSSSTITFPTSYTGTNNDLSTYIGYFFHDVTGYQKIGTYTGNGSANGTIVETGFEIAFLLIKRKDGGNSSWAIHDNKRSTSNPRNLELFANLADAESTFTAVDFLNNGFQLATSNALYNNNGNTYLYWAIAADPSTASTPVVTNAFDVVTWTGTGSNTDILADTSPDFVWGKRRDNAIGDTNHFLFDSIRGVESRLMSNSQANETVVSDEVTAFNEKGFSVGVDPSTNGSGGSMVAFLWSAGSHEGNLPTINTAGDIDSTVSVNDAAGFSIIKWTSDGGSTATTKGHGMSAAVDFALVKSMDSSSIWYIFHKDLPQNKYIAFNTDGLSPDGGTTYFTTSTTTLGFRDGSNSSSGDRMIAYAWREISGYSSVGTYTGNGSATGTIVTTGFKPRWVLLKCTNSGGTNWRIIDSTRDTSNPRSNYINADTAGQEQTAYAQVDFLDNGFQLKTTDTSINGNGNEHIYFALA